MCVGDCLEMLDELESAVTGLYRRVVVITDSGRPAWSYQYGWGIEEMIAIRSGIVGTAHDRGRTRIRRLSRPGLP